MPPRLPGRCCPHLLDPRLPKELERKVLRRPREVSPERSSRREATQPRPRDGVDQGRVSEVSRVPSSRASRAGAGLRVRSWLLPPAQQHSRGSGPSTWSPGLREPDRASGRSTGSGGELGHGDVGAVNAAATPD